MSKQRMEAFSDGVIAILITILVLEFKAPEGNDWAALQPLMPNFLGYVLSFLFLAIYWNNHHHLLQAVTQVRGSVLWANMHLLFWLSLIPFVTAWMDRLPLAAWPVAMYGVVLLFAAIAYTLLTRALIALHGSDSTLAVAIGKDIKGNISMGLYLIAILAAFFVPWASVALYVLVAIIWLFPDQRIERTLVRE